MNLNLWKSMAIWVNERSQVMILWGAVDGSASFQRMAINGHWVGKKVTSHDLRARWMDRHISVTGPVRARGRAAAILKYVTKVIWKTSSSGTDFKTLIELRQFCMLPPKKEK